MEIKLKWSWVIDSRSRSRSILHKTKENSKIRGSKTWNLTRSNSTENVGKRKNGERVMW